MLIYIRHSDDEVDDPTHAHDPTLTSEGKKLAKKVGQKLIAKYGLPDIIFCSPFRRTKQTLKYMLHQQRKDSIKIYYDNRLSRYFSEREQRHPDVDDSTLRAHVPIYETKRQFLNRAEELVSEMNVFIEGEPIVWCITHTSFYKRISKLYHITLPEFIPFMHYLRIRRRISSN